MKYKIPKEISTYRASGAERLEKLANFLDGVPRSKFSFVSWRTCAVGLAAITEPWFQAQGLTLEPDDRENDWRPCYEGRTDWMAVSLFFGIGVGEARRLLDPSGYGGNLRPHPREVAAKIRAYSVALTAVA